MIQDIFAEEGNSCYKDKNLLKFVLSKYELEVKNVIKRRGVYEVDCVSGKFCLKKVKHGKTSILNENYLIENLQRNGFANIKKMLRTREGNLIVKTNKYFFCISEDVEGEDCDLGNTEEAVNCAILLGRLHSSLNNLDTKVLNIKSKLKDRPKIFYDKLLTLEKYKQIIQKKRIKNEFDLMYLNYIDNFYNMGSMALNILNTSNYYILTKESFRKKTLCIGNFYSQNIIRRDDGYYISDLNNIYIDLQVLDLAKFIRRLMNKKQYKWNFHLAKHIIDGYSTEKTIKKEELEFMLAVITFPDKFWKLGKKRYIKQKDWSEPKYTQKIEKLINQFTFQQKFFMDFLNYINNLESLNIVN
jgi:CotS family spore coat protein